MERYRNRFLLKALVCLIAFWAGIFTLSGCATHREHVYPGGEVIDSSSALFDFTDDQYDPFKEYRIYPGDLLDIMYQVTSWSETDRFTIAVDHLVSVRFIHTPELNVEQMVRPNGKITLPYLGEVYVVEKTVDELEKHLKKRYSKIFKNPSHFVVVPDFKKHITEFKQDLHTAPRGLSRLVTVGPDGWVTFPMVGNINVAGLTIAEIDAKLTELYQSIMPGMNVDIFLEKHRPLNVYVVGEVAKPGAYDITKATPLVHILTLAGTPFYWANLTDVVVMRKRDDKILATRVNIKNMLTPPETCLDFSGTDFKEPLSVEDLCVAIDADSYPLSLDSERDTISKLNAILTVPNFYEMVCSRTGRSVNTFSKDTQALIVKTSGYRNGKDFSRLNDEEQTSIRMLNRLLLEDVYTNLTPKYLARANKMIYLRPDDMVYVPKRTLKKMAEFMTDLKSIAMFNGWGASIGFGYQLHMERIHSMTHQDGNQTIIQTGQ
ncbi:MAG: polysaccharide biosynthesis/export family protein [Planctomycetota bacterium]